MRVCLICNQIAAWGKIGGFGTNTRRLAGALTKAGVEVHVVVPRRPGQQRVEQLDGFVVHGQSTFEVFFGQKLYREIDADIYHGEEPTIAWANACKAMPNRGHLVTSMDPRDAQDWKIERQNASWQRRLKYPIQRYYEDAASVHKAVQHANGVFVETDFLIEKTQRLYNLPQPPGVLPKPVFIPKGPFEKSKQPTCVFLGRFDARKRPEMFFQLAERMAEVQFIAVGRAHDADYQKYLEKRYFHIENLHVTGFIDPFDETGRMRDILSRSWILVHPAAREGLPTAFQEASGHEMAILAYVNPADYVRRFGQMLEEGGGIEGLEQALRDMIRTDAWREKARAGREWNLKHHSIEVSLQKHLQVYQQYLKNKDTKVIGDRLYV